MHPIDSHPRLGRSRRFRRNRSRHRRTSRQGRRGRLIRMCRCSLCRPRFRFGSKAVSVLVVVVVASAVLIDAVVPNLLGAGKDVSVGVIAVCHARIARSVSSKSVAIIVELGQPLIDVRLGDPVACRKQQGKEAEWLSQWAPFSQTNGIATIAWLQHGVRR